MLIIFGKLIDFIDLRLYSFVVSLGLFLACFGMFIFYENIVFLFLIIFALRFFGQGGMSHAGETTMARYFGKDRGKAISVSTLGGMTGFIILPLIVVKLSNFFAAQYIWLIASLSIILFIPFLFLILDSQKIRHKSFRQKTIDDPLNKKWRTRDVLLDHKFYVYLPLSISAPFICTGLMFHQIFIITQKNWTFEMLGAGYVFLGIFSIIGLVIGGPIIDKYDTRKSVLSSLLPVFLGIFVLLFFENYIFLFVYMSLLGLTFGISTPFFGALWAELYGVESLGAVKAVLHASMVFASALSPLIFGYLIDWGFGILTIVIISIIVIVFSIIWPLYKKLP